MAQCLVCGEKVKHQWEHKECQIKNFDSLAWKKCIVLYIER